MEGECTVYVALLEEGTSVWRPVSAGPLGASVYRLRGAIPEGESWQFAPGAVVRCEGRVLSGGPALVAVALARTGAS